MSNNAEQKILELIDNFTNENTKLVESINKCQTQLQLNRAAIQGLHKQIIAVKKQAQADQAKAFSKGELVYASPTHEDCSDKTRFRFISYEPSLKRPFIVVDGQGYVYNFKYVKAIELEKRF